ncbi:MAG: hypothetical protein WAQ25_03445 [Candidatus Saccharimonas sp.]
MKKSRSLATPAVKKVQKKAAKATLTTGKVDIYPNRMTVAISALAGTLLVLLAIIAVLGSQ